MYVVVTAGHVDHGKSTLVKALTGSDPDRLAEERRRGLTIELGYCWTVLDGVGYVAFVDVPGHERFVSTMLAGVGPVPAVLFVVAADDPWMPQAAEHLAALDALGVSNGVVAVTRSDLADPEPCIRRVAAELDATTLRGAPIVRVSGRTGAGLDDLRTHLAAMLHALPAPDASADVRLWVDRRFTIRGAGTVVTGTLPAGTVSRGDILTYGDGRARVRVRGVQSLGTAVPEAHGVARVALNLTGDDLGALDRGTALVTPDAWHLTDVVDVRLRTTGGSATGGSPPPERPMLHVGAASVAAHRRPLGEDLVRLTLGSPLPLRVGDRALIRDPGDRRLWGLVVLDPAPPRLERRGAGRRRAKQLAASSGLPSLTDELRRRGLAPVELLRRIGVPCAAVAQPPGTTRAAGWVMSAERAEQAARAVTDVVTRHVAASPLDPALPLAVVAELAHLPSPGLIEAVLQPPLRLENGRVTTARADGLPVGVELALAALRTDLEAEPFAAPTADRLRELGLDSKAVAASAKAQRLLRLAPGVVLLPEAEQTAVLWLQQLDQPFTASQARAHLRTSRRVVLPLLEHLDRTGRTRRHPDDRRTLIG